MRLARYHVLICLVLGVATLVGGATSRTQQKAPIPDAQAEARGKKAAQEIYGDKFAQAKTAAQKSGLAKDMLETAATVAAGSADQYALLKIARDVATGAGDVVTALAAAEKLGEQFDVPTAQLKGQALLAAAGKASSLGAQKAVAEAALKIAEARVTSLWLP